MREQGKGNIGSFFEDFEVGQDLACPTPRVVTSAETAWHIATTNDRTPRFCSAEGRVSPIIVFHVVIGQTVRYVSLNARANLGYAGMIWRTPVFNGDEISTRIRIVGLKENSNGETGNVYVETIGRNQRGEVVLEYTRWVMVPKRDADQPTRYLEAPVVPELPPQVRVAELPEWSGPLSRTEETGGQYFYEDYTVGERICHHDGMTVNHSDHMSYTRLWQNSAKVHFDALFTENRILVYGGFPLAVAYAQAFNGLENRSGIQAMNAGTHANPCYPGATIYSYSEVLEKHDRGSASAGALRLRLVAVRDLNPANEPGFTLRVKDEKGRERYDPRVLLDVDLWELMPKRGR
jgi:2-methylfumaryl-CoA hydratase